MNPAIPVSLYVNALLPVLYNGYCAVIELVNYKKNPGKIKSIPCNEGSKSSTGSTSQ